MVYDIYVRFYEQKYTLFFYKIIMFNNIIALNNIIVIAIKQYHVFLFLFLKIMIFDDNNFTVTNRNRFYFLNYFIHKIIVYSVQCFRKLLYQNYINLTRNLKNS